METPNRPHHGHEPTAELRDLDPSELAECPVMRGTMVVKAEAEENGLVREYGDQRYHLCCDTCAVLWDENPQQYAG